MAAGATVAASPPSLLAGDGGIRFHNSIVRVRWYLYEGIDMRVLATLPVRT
jgi:hypothetical protein